MPTRLSNASPAEIPARVKGCCQQLAPPVPAPVVDELAAMLKALADPTRLQMVHMLAAAGAPVCVCDFTAAFELGQPTVSHHLGKLRDAGLVTSHRQGIWAFYALVPRLPAVVRAVLGQFAPEPA
ncbi:MAG: metalloregulator ArsR/SmtB family transcription factor [Candidatus Dormibacteria bacterium]